DTLIPCPILGHAWISFHLTPPPHPLEMKSLWPATRVDTSASQAYVSLLLCATFRKLSKCPISPEELVMEKQVRRFAILPVITLLWVSSTVIGQAPPPLDSAEEKKDGQAVPESEAHSNYELAVSFFKSGNYESAGRWLEEFLKRHPQSADAPEAAYYLAMSFILQDKPEEAKKVFDRIVADYFSSPWAGIVLRAHYDEDAVFKLADEKHAKGRREKNAKETAAALQIFELYGVRTKGQKNKAELIYKVGDCCH